TTLRSGVHERRCEGQTRPPPKRLDDRRSHGEIRHKVPVHHVHVDPVGPTLFRLGHLLAQPGAVGRENRRGEFYGHRGLTCWRPRRCSESTHPTGRCTPHPIAERTALPPAP